MKNRKDRNRLKIIKPKVFFSETLSETIAKLDALLPDEDMRSHQIAMLGEQLLKSNKRDKCEG